MKCLGIKIKFGNSVHFRVNGSLNSSVKNFRLLLTYIIILLFTEQLVFLC